MSYRDDLAALSLRHRALEAEVLRKTQELEGATRLLEEARERRRLPMLDRARVASPCGASWEHMTGGDRVRRCGDCRQNVYNLSELTRDEAEALILEKEGQLCVRYYQRTDGTVLWRTDCPVGGARRVRRRRNAVVAAAVAVLVGVLGMLGLRRLGQRDPAGIEAESRRIEEYIRSHSTIGKYEGVRPGTTSQELKFE
jgi:hypothetical protein